MTDDRIEMKATEVRGAQWALAAAVAMLLALPGIAEEAVRDLRTRVAAVDAMVDCLAVRAAASQYPALYGKQAGDTLILQMADDPQSGGVYRVVAVGPDGEWFDVEKVS